VKQIKWLYRRQIRPYSRERSLFKKIIAKIGHFHASLWREWAMDTEKCTHVAMPAGGHIARGRRWGATLKDELPYPGRPMYRTRGLGAPCRFTRSSPQSSPRGRSAPAHIPDVVVHVVVVVVAVVVVVVVVLVLVTVVDAVAVAVAVAYVVVCDVS